MTTYYTHDNVAPKISVVNNSEYLSKVIEYATKNNFVILYPEPGYDVFSSIVNYKGKDILVVLKPGDYYETAYRVSGAWKTLWVVGDTYSGERPRIRALRPLDSPYSSPSRLFSAGSKQTLIIEHLEIAGFGGDTITQSAEADLIIRNTFIHSNGGRALFRGVGSYMCPFLGSTILIDSEFRDANSHTIYLDYGGTTIISGCHVSRQGKNSHCIKNISQITLVENNIFETDIVTDDYTNAWVSVYATKTGNPGPWDGTPRNYSGSTPYDGMSGTTYSHVVNNTFIMPAGNGAMVSLQTRSAANGNLPAYPLPEVEWLNMTQAHLDASSYYIDTDIAPGWGFTQKVAAQGWKTGASPSEMWTEDYWNNYTPAKHYWIDNNFVLTGDAGKANNMIGIALAHNHPVTWSVNNGKLLPVSDYWLNWITSKLDQLPTINFYSKGNIFPEGLVHNISWIAGIDAHYGILPSKDKVVLPLESEVSEAPQELRRWDGLSWLMQDFTYEVPSTTPVEPPVVEPPQPVEPLPDTNAPEWKSIVKAEYQDDKFYFEELLRYKAKGK